MSSPSRLPPNVAALLHLLAGALLGIGLVGVTLMKESNPADDSPRTFQRWVRTLTEWGVLGAVGGLLGGIVSGLRAADGDTRAAGLRFWMVALGAGGALTLGAIALQNVSAVASGEGDGPAVRVLTWLCVGWLAGVLLGAVGAAFAQTTSSALTATLRRATTGRSRNGARFVGALLGGVMWAVFWGVLVALLVLLALGVVRLSVRAGDAGPALAVGGTCGCIFFGLRYVLFRRSAAGAE